ncbi:hypothetical protein B5807_00705 [Epicoccum nigrum]|uniref:Uncharacterized protein n=1 Tax=Epicoccum nigrum TaxID=105696 RepID=A0A1Y2MC18_EPING|nr:hypothetical protein B5807_00705 [Epicoccum nigrum]
MAPDLNSVPVSPRPGITSAPSHTSTRQPSTPASRRASQVHHMSPPLPLASPGRTLPASHASHTHAFPPLSPGLSSGADSAHAPMRHPRPLTAAELHLELEKEQEAVVNRLTRELTQLRAHSASVASTVSSVTSGGAGAGGDADVAPGNAGVYPPTSSSTAAAAAAARRERRSSSSVSRYSFGVPVPTATTSASHGQNRSQRHSISSQQGQVQGNSHHGVEMRRSSSILSTPRYEEVAQQQAVLEEVKKENEVLKERIRELERAIRGRGGEGEGERGRRGAPSGEGVGAGAAGSAPTSIASPPATSAAE